MKKKQTDKHYIGSCLCQNKEYSLALIVFWEKKNTRSEPRSDTTHHYTLNKKSDISVILNIF